MDDKLERVAFAAGSDPDIIEKLNDVLQGENDRAFVVCVHHDCTHNTKGRCTIFAVKDVPKMRRTSPCEKYEARTLQTPS